MSRSLKPLSAENAKLLVETIESQAPELLPVVNRLLRNETIDDPDAERLERALSQAMTSDYTIEDGLTARGSEIDDLIGLCRQHARSFFSGA